MKAEPVWTLHHLCMVCPVRTLSRPSEGGSFLSYPCFSPGFGLLLLLMACTYNFSLRGLPLCWVLAVSLTNLWRPFTNDWYVSPAPLLCLVWPWDQINPVVLHSWIRTLSQNPLPPCLFPSSSLSYFSHTTTGFSWEFLLHKLLAHNAHLKMKEIHLGQLSNV